MNLCMSGKASSKNLCPGKATLEYIQETQQEHAGISYYNHPGIPNESMLRSFSGVPVHPWKFFTGALKKHLELPGGGWFQTRL